MNSINTHTLFTLHNILSYCILFMIFTYAYIKNKNNIGYEEIICNLINWTLIFSPCILLYKFNQFELVFGEFGCLIDLLGWYVTLDTYFYFMHRWFHKNKWIFNNIHFLHHTGIPQTIFDAQYSHPLETIIITIPSYWMYIFFKIYIFKKFNFIAFVIINVSSIYYNLTSHIYDGFHLTHHY